MSLQLLNEKTVFGIKCLLPKNLKKGWEDLAGNICIEDGTQSDDKSDVSRKLEAVKLPAFVKCFSDGSFAKKFIEALNARMSVAPGSVFKVYQPFSKTDTQSTQEVVNYIASALSIYYENDFTHSYSQLYPQLFTANNYIVLIVNEFSDRFMNGGGDEVSVFLWDTNLCK